MTTPTPLANLNLGQLLADVEKGVADVQAALAFIEKFQAFLPPAYAAPLQELNTILATVEDFLHKL